MMSMIESDEHYGPHKLGYFAQDVSTFAQWMKVQAPTPCWKIHVSVQPNDAVVVARSVLPKLRNLKVAHKVVNNRTAYLRLHQGDQRGKFITIYIADHNRAQKVLDRIDPELYVLRKSGLVRPGPVPHTRESNHKEPEIRVGKSGMVFTRWSSEG